ncbi:MAG TPA: hypothetical protein VLA02_14485 [Reyranella sp.]|nr:hypothetical protein [Reyranella sp.]
MFTLFLEHDHRVLLACFTGTLTLEDIAGYDRAVMLTLGREGPVRGIIDLSDIDAVAVPHDRLRDWARQPPMVVGQERIFVATKPATLAAARSYSALQRNFGGIGPQIVATRCDAYELLGLVDPKFEALVIP